MRGEAHVQFGTQRGFGRPRPAAWCLRAGLGEYHSLGIDNLANTGLDYQRIRLHVRISSILEVNCEGSNMAYEC